MFLIRYSLLGSKRINSTFSLNLGRITLIRWPDTTLSSITMMFLWWTSFKWWIFIIREYAGSLYLAFTFLRSVVVRNILRNSQLEQFCRGKLKVVSFTWKQVKWHLQDYYGIYPNKSQIHSKHQSKSIVIIRYDLVKYLQYYLRE